MLLLFFNVVYTIPCFGTLRVEFKDIKLTALQNHTWKVDVKGITFWQILRSLSSDPAHSIQHFASSALCFGFTASSHQPYFQADQQTVLSKQALLNPLYTTFLAQNCRQSKRLTDESFVWLTSNKNKQTNKKENNQHNAKKAIDAALMIQWF